MFIDLVGSTDLATGHDAEDVRDILRAYHHVVGVTVEAAGGMVTRLIGDGILVFFGYPTATDDSARRAVECGLAVVRAVRELDLGDVIADPLTLSCRVGIHTGVVYVGPMQSAGRVELHDVVGETPNLAARLQSVAGPDEVIIGDTTHQRVTGWFECAGLGAIDLKGFPEPVVAHRVLRRSTARTRVEARQDFGRFVGRASQTQVILDAWSEVVDGSSRALCIVGGPGVGKSRLAADAIGRLGDVTVRRIVGDPLMVSDPLGAAGTLLRDVGLEVVDELADRSAWIDAAAATILSGVAGAAVVVVDDTESLDPSTVQLVRAMHQDPRPTLVVMAARLPFDPPEWCDTLELHGLDESEVAALAIELGASSDAAARIVERSDGVPLFVEELVRSAATGQQADLPDTLHDLLVARLDACGPARSLARSASVLGREFDLDDLGLLDLDEPQIEQQLHDLVALGVLVLHESARRWRFRHALLRDAAYDSVLRDTRRRLHATIAQRSVDRGRRPEFCAQHFERAGRHSEALRHWTDAARRARALGFPREAAALYERALECLDRTPVGPDRDAREWRLRSHHLAAFQSFHDHADPSLADLIDACSDAAMRCNEDEALPLRIVSATYFQAIGDYGRAHRELEVARQIAERIDVPGAVASIDIFIGCLYAWQGNHSAAREPLDSGLAISGIALDSPPDLPDAIVQPWSIRALAAGLGSAAIAATLRGAHDEADLRIEQGRTITAGHEAREPRSMLLVSDAIRHQLAGRREAALHSASEAKECLVDLESTQWVPWAEAIRGWVIGDAPLVRDALGALSPHASQMRSYVMALLADVDESADASVLIEEARRLMEHTTEAFHATELQRIDHAVKCR
jgi:class 3 adenylate cyclase/tetratricopeptide (TPR) repeat protein